MNNLQMAKTELSKVGGFLSKAMKEDQGKAQKIKQMLLTLKKVNTALENLINGDDEFSFDGLDEITSSQSSRMRETQKEQENDYGVDLGGFDNFVNAKDPNAFDWRGTFKEANSRSGDSINIDMDKIANSEFDENTIGRMVDNTPVFSKRRFV